MIPPIKEGYYELIPFGDERIEKGDYWCIRKTESNNDWMNTTKAGERLKDLEYNVYIRKNS
jgi:hypothetical protein